MRSMSRVLSGLNFVTKKGEGQTSPNHSSVKSLYRVRRRRNRQPVDLSLVRGALMKLNPPGSVFEICSADNRGIPLPDTYRVLV